MVSSFGIFFAMGASGMTPSFDFVHPGVPSRNAARNIDAKTVTIRFIETLLSGIRSSFVLDFGEVYVSLIHIQSQYRIKDPLIT
jgi:hypothetical protein